MKSQDEMPPKRHIADELDTQKRLDNSACRKGTLDRHQESVLVRITCKDRRPCFSWQSSRTTLQWTKIQRVSCCKFDQSLFCVIIYMMFPIVLSQWLLIKTPKPWSAVQKRLFDHCIDFRSAFYFRPISRYILIRYFA